MRKIQIAIYKFAIAAHTRVRIILWPIFVLITNIMSTIGAFKASPMDFCGTIISLSSPDLVFNLGMFGSYLLVVTTSFINLHIYCVLGH